MKITIIGTGYVGLVTGACFADLGNKVLCVDNDREKMESLRKGKVTIYEPDLEAMLKRNVKKGSISFSTSIRDGVKKSDVIFICVGTPSRESGEPDLLDLESVSRKIAESMTSYRLIVEKSTVPVETGEWVKRTIEAFSAKGGSASDRKRRKVKFDVASNPEFLREGSAIRDFMYPDRVVIGVESEKAEKLLLDLYKPLNAPVIVTDIKSAEIIKHASNSFLATKISFMNAIGVICEKAGADIKKVSKGMGLDKRIGPKFLNAGAGFGGSCFPKDLSAFIYIADKLGYSFDLLREVQKINENQKNIVIDKIAKSIWNITGKTIGVLGLSFKPNTDDIRNAPAIEIIKSLLAQGARIRAYDPKATEKAKKIFKNQITYCRDAYDTAKDSDCLVIVTDWDEFKNLDLKKLKKLLRQPAIVDGRNIFEPDRMKKMGFVYKSMGRKDD